MADQLADSEPSVVILDSDPCTLETLGLVLGRNFPNTQLFQSPLPAFATLMNQQVGVLICEVKLGDEDGLALAQALRGRVGNLTPIIFTSLQDSDELRKQIDTIPHSYFLPKSELQRLPSLVTRVLAEERSEPAAPDLSAEQSIA